MKIAMLTASMSRNGGGLFESVRHLAAAIARQPQTGVTVLAGEDAHSAADRPSWGEIPLHVGRVRGSAAFGWQPGLRQRLDEENPDILHLNGLWMYPSHAALRWSQARRRPRIIAPHGMLDPWALAVSGWKKQLVRLAFEDRNLQGATVLHALCEAEHDAMRAFGLRNPIAIIPNGVDPKTALGEHAAPPWADHLPQGARILLFLGRLHPKKGLVPLLRSMALAPDLDIWRLVIAGWDQNGHRAELEALARDLDLEERLHFTGPLHGAAKHAALAAADAFILPSFSEGLPMAVLEAWAFGLPVLMTAECNLPEGFDHGAAIKISTEPPALASALREMGALGARDLAMIGERGRQLAAGRYGWDQIAAELRAVCLWATEGGASPQSIREVGR